MLRKPLAEGLDSRGEGCWSEQKGEGEGFISFHGSRVMAISGATSKKSGQK